MRTNKTPGSNQWYADEKIWDWIFPNNYPAAVIEANGNLNYPYYTPDTDDWVVTGNNNALWNSYFTMWRTSDWTGEFLLNNLAGSCHSGYNYDSVGDPVFNFNPALDIAFAGFTTETECLANFGVWIPSSSALSPLYHEGTPIINQDVAYGRIDYLAR